jgi:hypothetical protein
MKIQINKIKPEILQMLTFHIKVTYIKSNKSCNKINKIKWF